MSSGCLKLFRPQFSLRSRPVALRSLRISSFSLLVSHQLRHSMIDSVCYSKRLIPLVIPIVVLFQSYVDYFVFNHCRQFSKTFLFSSSVYFRECRLVETNLNYAPLLLVPSISNFLHVAIVHHKQQCSRYTLSIQLLQLNNIIKAQKFIYINNTFKYIFHQ